MPFPLTYLANNCFLNAAINKDNHYKERGLRLVIGSLGLNGWFEFGGKDWGMREFRAKHHSGYVWDAHGWLEDADGNIYDQIFNFYDEVAVIRTGKHLKKRGLIEGESKDALRAVGLDYVPAAADVQAAIWKSMESWVTTMMTGLERGTTRVVGSGENTRLMTEGASLLGVAAAYGLASFESVTSSVMRALAATAAEPEEEGADDWGSILVQPKKKAGGGKKGKSKPAGRR